MSQQEKLARAKLKMWVKIIFFTVFYVLGFRVVGAATVTLQGGQTNQVIDGFGINANYRSWNGTELQPVLDAFIDQAGMTMFRVVRDLSDWEVTNDNTDSSLIDWTSYNPVYSSTEFTRLWNMFAYLNQRGITNGAFFNFMGWGPGWMMDSDGRTLKVGMEEEWAEMITSALVYARNTRGLQFSLIAPNNEPDIYHEGIRIPTASQYRLTLRSLALKLDANGLGDLRFVGPDRSGGGTDYMPEMVSDAVVMGKLKHFGVHSYSGSGGGSAGVRAFIQNSAYPDRTFWMTEFNVWCGGCDTGTPGIVDWAYARGTADYLLAHLLNGASACFPWEGYDSIYAHHGSVWSYWGLIAVDNINAAVKTYTRRKNFYTVAQISKWVRPGAQRISINVSGSLSPFSYLLAFKHQVLGQVTLVGVNPSASPASLVGTLASLPNIAGFDLYYTSATTNLAYGGWIGLTNGAFNTIIPADCVFTLTGSTRVSAALTNPVNGARFTAPATLPLIATTASPTGAVAQVRFYNGTNELGSVTTLPYQYTWGNVPMGDYALQAIVWDKAGNRGTSGVVNVTVVGPLAELGISPASVVVAAGGTKQFAVIGKDGLGNVLNPLPQVSWSVNGGGIIDNSGLFTAGTISGTFNVTATSGNVAGNTSIFLPGVQQVFAPWIESMRVTSGVANLRWTTLPDRFYRVQYLDDWRSTNWLDLAPDLRATDTTLTQTNQLNGQPMRLYRVILLP